MNDLGENRSYAKLSDQEYLMLKVITSFIKEPKRDLEFMHNGNPEDPPNKKVTGLFSMIRNIFDIMVGRVGIGPTTNGLKVRCSTGLS